MAVGAIVAAAIAVPLALSHKSPSVQTRPPLTGLAAINRTCAVDDTKALQAYLDSLKSGSVADFTGDCIQADGTIWVRGKQRLTIEGGKWEQLAPVEDDTDVRNSALTHPYCGKSTYTDDLYSEPTHTAVIMFWFEGGCDITLKNMTFLGQSTGPGAGIRQEDSFIQFNGTQRALVENVRMKGPYGDYVTASSLLECGNCGSTYPATDITVENSHFDHAGRQGIGIVNVDRMAVRDNVFGSAADTMFDVEVDSHGGTQSNIDIADNVIAGQHYGFLISGGTGAPVDRFQFSGNRMIDGAQMRIFFSDGSPGSNLRIDHNVASAAATWSGGHRPAIQISGVKLPISIDHNIVPVGKAGLAVVPKGSIVCEQACVPIHVVGPEIAQLP